MAVVTHVIPQTFTDAAPVINIVTPAQTQDIVVAQTGDSGQVISVPLTTTQSESKTDHPSLELEKQLIYKHPLFPLMALMFERCEQASASADHPSQDSCDSDIQVFIQHQEKEKKSLYSNDPDLDNLMIKAVQVLRIHLLELEKVNELCQDFCTRYTTCLKGKLQSENLLRTESDYEQSMFDEPPQEGPQSAAGTLVQQAPGGTSGANVILQPNFQTASPSVPTVQALGPGQIMSGGTVYQMVQTPQGLVAQPIQIQPTITSLSTPVIHGSTPLSQIGLSPQTLVGTTVTNSVANSLADFDSDDDDVGKKKNKRGVLPKSATQVMKSWLFQHIVHPYPTEDEKRQIAQQTNLTLLQVNNWFINARRRILQPMLDAGNPEPSKAKKPKIASKPSQRFWPFAGIEKSAESSSSKSEPKVPLMPLTAVKASVPAAGTQTIILPSDFSSTLSPQQLMSIHGGSMVSVLEQMKQSTTSPPSSPHEKECNDNNNNSHNTDNDISDSENPT